MGFKLDCPNCGRRSYHEFWFGGELRPHDPGFSDEEDYRNTWMRTNAAGPQQDATKIKASPLVPAEPSASGAWLATALLVSILVGVTGFAAGRYLGR